MITKNSQLKPFKGVRSEKFFKQKGDQGNTIKKMAKKSIQLRKLNKIDKRMYFEARAMGKSQVEAYKFAGGIGKNDMIIASNASTYEKTHNMKGDILKLMKEKRFQAIRALTMQKANEESYRDLVISIAALTDKIQLLEGKPTEQVANITKIYLPRKQESF